jgi:DNA polymerase-3 subunit beta
MIRRTLIATDTESTRYALGGVLVDLQKESLTLAATDTRRLAVINGACSVHGTPEPAATAPVIPSKAMSLIERSLGEEQSEPICFALRNNDVMVRTSHTTLYSRLVEGRFPKYQDVIPKSHTVSVELLANAFYSAVRQAQIVTNEESRGVDFEFSEGLLTLRSQAADIGQSKIELPVGYDGPELTITFDPRYVAEFLKVLEPEQQVRLELIDSESAAVFRTGDGYVYIIMPLSRDR